MSRRPADRRTPFVDLVAEARSTPAPGLVEAISSALQAGVWRDAAGREYRRRGQDEPSPARLRRLFAEPTCLVVHSYLGTDTLVTAEARVRLLNTVEPNLTQNLARVGHDQTEYRAGEFRGPAGERMVLVEERC